MLQKWAALTGQSAQVDTGYIAQFVASIVLGEPGQGFRGKGDDLADGSEVKGAANISGVDRPRWNHNLGTPSDDDDRREAGDTTRSEEYLSSPHLFYLLVDRLVGDSQSPSPIRVRGWCLDASEDLAWRNLFGAFVSQRTPKQYNLQLHPPVGYDDDIVVNTLGNLDFADVLVFDARVNLEDRSSPTVDWHSPIAADILPIRGRTRALPYGGPRARPSRLTDASDLVADIGTLAELFPGVLSPEEEFLIADVSLAEAESDE